MNVNKKIAIVCLVLLLFLGIILSMLPKEETTAKEIDLSISAIPHSILVFIALENNYFEDEGLNVNVHHYSSGKLALDSLLFDKSDFATTADFPLALAGVNNLETYIITTMGFGDDVKIIAHNDIKEVSDLKGKTVATFKGTGADFFMQKFFAEQKIPLEELNIVNLVPQNMIPAFVNKDIDAFIIWEPHIYNANKLLNNKATIFSPKGVYGETWNIAINKNLLDEEETIISFLNALKKAEMYYRNNPEESITIAQKYSGAEKDVVEEIFSEFNIGLYKHAELVPQMLESAYWLDEDFDGEAIFDKMQKSEFLDYIDTK